jgi:hypothetical protein
LNGSFVTAKDEPGDFDACWAIPDRSRRPRPVLLDLERSPSPEDRFGGEFFPNVVEAGSGLVFAEFFQRA